MTSHLGYADEPKATQPEPVKEEQPKQSNDLGYSNNG
jgi:hypothetical protein